MNDVFVAYPESGVALVTFAGEHDLASRDELSALLRRLVMENESVVADFSDAQFVDSAVIHVLFAAGAEARDHGRMLQLRLGSASIVSRAFELMGVFDRLDCIDFLDEDVHGGVAAVGAL